MKTTFSSPVATAEFSKLADISGFELAQLELITSTSFARSDAS